MSAASTQVHSPLSALVARDVAKAYGDRVVLDGVDLVAAPGIPSGSSARKRCRQVHLPAAAGRSGVPGRRRHRRQADRPRLPPPGNRSSPRAPRSATCSTTPWPRCTTRVARLEALADRIDLPDVAVEYDATLTWATVHEAWDSDRRAAAAAARLGLGRLDRHRLVAAMSGGQRSRLALAALVTRRPACVLLDEPTNHLDDEATALLEEFLVSLPGVVVVAATTASSSTPSATSWWTSTRPTWAWTAPGATGSPAASPTTSPRSRTPADGGRRRSTPSRNSSTACARRRPPPARQVAPNRPPRDADKFIHHFKGQKVARTVSRRVGTSNAGST